MGTKKWLMRLRFTGFGCFDVTTNDIINHPDILNQYSGQLLLGGFHTEMF